MVDWTRNTGAARWLKIVNAGQFRCECKGNRNNRRHVTTNRLCKLKLACLHLGGPKMLVDGADYGRAKWVGLQRRGSVWAGSV